VAGGADPSQPAGALVQGLHWRHRSRGLSAPSESSVGSDSDSGADGIPGSRVAGYSHPWPKRIRLAEPETNSPSDQSTPPGGARSSPAPAVGGPAYGFMVGLLEECSCSMVVLRGQLAGAVVGRPISGQPAGVAHKRQARPHRGSARKISMIPFSVATSGTVMARTSLWSELTQ
jgi:hypothetical protein